MKILPRFRASAFYWILVAALGGWLLMLSSSAHAPQKALELTPVMHVVKVEDSAPEPQEPSTAQSADSQAPQELPSTSLVVAPAPPKTPAAAPKPAPDPRALEAQLRDALAHEGFPNVGVSVGRDGEVYLAGTLFDDSEPDQINQVVRKVPGVTDVHFTEVQMARPSGHGYIGTQTGSAKEGVRVIQVFRGSPAQAAGIKKGDVIVSFDDRPVKDPDEFRAMVRSRAGGTRVAVLIARGNQREVREVRLGQSAEMAEK